MGIWRESSIGELRDGLIESGANVGLGAGAMSDARENIAANGEQFNAAREDVAAALSALRTVGSTLDRDGKMLNTAGGDVHNSAATVREVAAGSSRQGLREAGDKLGTEEKRIEDLVGSTKRLDKSAEDVIGWLQKALTRLDQLTGQSVRLVKDAEESVNNQMGASKSLTEEPRSL